MKIRNTPPRPGLPTRFKDRIVFRYDPRFGQIAQSWPRKQSGGRPRGDPAKVALWDMAVDWVKSPEPSEYIQALEDTKGTAFYARDILISAIYGNFVSWPGWGWRAEMAQSIQLQLDSITDLPGSILYRAEDGWHGLAPGPTGYVLTISDLGAFPIWAAAAPATPTTVLVVTGETLTSAEGGAIPGLVVTYDGRPLYAAATP